MSQAHGCVGATICTRIPITTQDYMLPDRPEAEAYEPRSFPVKTIFQKVYGSKEPGELVAIGIKSDSNNIGGDSLAYLKTLRLIR